MPKEESKEGVTVADESYDSSEGGNNDSDDTETVDNSEEDESEVGDSAETEDPEESEDDSTEAERVLPVDCDADIINHMVDLFKITLSHRFCILSVDTVDHFSLFHFYCSLGLCHSLTGFGHAQVFLRQSRALSKEPFACPFAQGRQI